MVVTVFQVIGVISIFLAALVVIIVFYFLNKGLRHLNSVLDSRRKEIGRDLRTSLEGLDEAQGQIEALSAATAGVRAGMDSAISAADTAVSFLRSSAFQIGVPAAMWLLLVLIAIPRALRSPARKKSVKVIPPPSWQADLE